MSLSSWMLCALEPWFLQPLPMLAGVLSISLSDHLGRKDNTR